jgi:hypothetical protein
MGGVAAISPIQDNPGKPGLVSICMLKLNMNRNRNLNRNLSRNLNLNLNPHQLHSLF